MRLMKSEVRVVCVAEMLIVCNFTGSLFLKVVITL